MQAIALGMIERFKASLERTTRTHRDCRSYVSGLEFFAAVWFARAALPDGLRRYRDKTVRRVRAGC